jgi:hypothetical protein
MTHKLIGVVGLIGAGKDTVADYLVNLHHFRRDSFAASLKDAVAHVFGWDRILLEGRTKQAREWREKIDDWWADRLNMPDLTPRLVLQLWGTEACRKGFHDSIWIASLENKLRNIKDNVVISDCRFPNEIKSIKNAGGIVIRVVRGPDPIWYNDALTCNAGPGHSEWRIAKTRMIEYNIHDSETAWVGTKFDAVIDNNGSFSSLFLQIDNLINGQVPDLRVSTESQTA